MLSNKKCQKVNQNCISCTQKVKENYYVLSDHTYIHKMCLEMVKKSSSDDMID
jgi:hypothetical protein